MDAVDLHACQVVSTERWNDGRPVRIQAAHVHAGKVAVRWQDARCCGSIHTDYVDLGMPVDLISGGCHQRPLVPPTLASVDEAAQVVAEGLDSLFRRIGRPAEDGDR